MTDRPVPDVDAAIGQLLTEPIPVQITTAERGLRTAQHSGQPAELLAAVEAAIAVVLHYWTGIWPSSTHVALAISGEPPAIEVLGPDNEAGTGPDDAWLGDLEEHYDDSVALLTAALTLHQPHYLHACAGDPGGLTHTVPVAGTAFARVTAWTPTPPTTY